MARPPVLQKLKHGKLLTGGAFRFFVETWNWLVGYTDNLVGDADLNAANGFITVDRTDPDHPVIRFVNIPQGGGGGGGLRVPEPFEYVAETEPAPDDEEQAVHYVKADSFYFDGGLQTVDSDLEIEQTGSVTAYLVCYGAASKNADDEIEYTWTFSLDDEPQEADEPASADDPPDKVLNVKLYDFEDGEVVKDYRGVNLPVMSGSPVVSSIEDYGVFAPVYDSSTGLVSGFKNCYYQVGGFTYDLGDQSSLPITTGFVCLKITPSSGSVSAELIGKTSLSNVNSDQASLSNVIIPLYKVSSSKIEVDLRRTPTTGILEYFPQQQTS